MDSLWIDVLVAHPLGWGEEVGFKTLSEVGSLLGYLPAGGGKKHHYSIFSGHLRCFSAKWHARAGGSTLMS